MSHQSGIGRRPFGWPLQNGGLDIAPIHTRARAYRQTRMLMKRRSFKKGTRERERERESKVLPMKVDIGSDEWFFALSVCYICKSFAYMNIPRYGKYASQYIKYKVLKGIMKEKTICLQLKRRDSLKGVAWTLWKCITLLMKHERSVA